MLEVTGAAKPLAAPPAANPAAITTKPTNQQQQQQQQPAAAALDWPAHYASSSLAADNTAAGRRLVADCLDSCPPLKVPGVYAASFG